MNYFINNLFRDKLLWAGIALSIVAALNLLDFLSFAFAAPGFFNLWVIKGTIGAAVVGTIIYALFLNRREKRSRQLRDLLPVLQAERRLYFAARAAEDPGFQTFCHECRHYDTGRRRCLLQLQERKVWIKLQPEDAFSYCLYWNLDGHPVLALTGQVKELKREHDDAAPSNH